MEAHPDTWEPWEQAHTNASAASDPTSMHTFTREAPQPDDLHAGVVYLFSVHPRSKYLYMAKIQYVQGNQESPHMGVTNRRVDSPHHFKCPSWAHRAAGRLLLQKVGLTPDKYRLYPTAFRLPVPEGQRPLSRKATHLVAVAAILQSAPDVLDLQAHTNEATYFEALPARGQQWVYLGPSDQREMSCKVSWTPFHAHYRCATIPQHQWAWIDQIAE